MLGYRLGVGVLELLFFILRIMLFYYLSYWGLFRFLRFDSGNHYLALCVGIWLACGSHIRLKNMFKKKKGDCFE